MDPRRFDDMVRSLPTAPRRDLLAGLVGGFFSVLPLVFARDAGARKNHRRKKRKKLEFNEFGCVDVGAACRGNDANCCSGICDGSKPKKGKRDTSRCVGHDSSTCQPGQSIAECAAGSTTTACQTTAGENGKCVTTTGKAPYCYDSGECFACRRDADCVPYCGAGAACFVCAGCSATGGTACVGVESCLGFVD